jgi:hypothetical protein
MTKEQMELRFGKGPEHEELCDLFAEFAFQLDRRLPDGDQKNDMLSNLDLASQRAHEALKVAYPSIKDLKPLSDMPSSVSSMLKEKYPLKEAGTGVKVRKEDLESREGIDAWEKYPQQMLNKKIASDEIMEIPETKVSTEDQ